MKHKGSFGKGSLKLILYNAVYAIFKNKARRAIAETCKGEHKQEKRRRGTDHSRGIPYMSRKKPWMSQPKPESP